MIIEILQISLIAFMFYALGEEGMIFNWYRKLICKLPEWLCRPLGGCPLCIAGQIALWYYLIFHFATYNFIDHLFFVSAVIFCSMIYRKVWLFLIDDI